MDRDIITTNSASPGTTGRNLSNSMKTYVFPILSLPVPPPEEMLGLISQLGKRWKMSKL
jgi:hypothetical protein